MKSIFDFMAKYNLHIDIERCDWKDGFIITVYKHGCNRSSFISDAQLMICEEDYLLFVIKGMVSELLKEEQKHLKVAEQFKNINEYEEKEGYNTSILVDEFDIELAESMFTKHELAKLYIKKLKEVEQLKGMKWKTITPKEYESII